MALKNLKGLMKEKVMDDKDNAPKSGLAARLTGKKQSVDLGDKGSFTVKKGALHRMLGVPQGEKIPKSDLKPKPSDSPLLRRRKASALGFRAMKHGGK